MQAVLASCPVSYKRDQYFGDLKLAHRHHWRHLGYRIIGRPVVLIPKHVGALIIIQTLTLVCLFIAFWFSLVAFNEYHVNTGPLAYGLYGLHPRYEQALKPENRTVLHDETTWAELKKGGELALIGFCFIIASQGLVAVIILFSSCYRCWKLKHMTRTWEVMPFCIGSTLLFLSGALECYYATNYKKMDVELPHYIRKSWMIAAVLTLMSAVLGIVNTCLLLGSEARIAVRTGDGENVVIEHVDQHKALIDNQ